MESMTCFVVGGEMAWKLNSWDGMWKFVAKRVSRETLGNGS